MAAGGISVNVDAIIEELDEIAKHMGPDCIVCKAIDKLREQAAEIERLKKTIESM